MPLQHTRRRLSTSDLQERTGATYRQVVHWCSRGLLVPLNPQCGSGHRFEFDPVEARVCAALVRVSPNADVMAHVADVVRNDPHADSWAIVVRDGFTVLVDA